MTGKSMRKTDTLKQTDSRITICNSLDHFLARWGINRSGHRVDPGLYSIGDPGKDSPVFISANYTLSFDALRKELGSIDGYILVLDTKGVNVWCAAGKGTFGTEELVNRIEAASLSDLVDHRKVIVPQLGAAGVCAREVKNRSGFKVEFGPVRAEDIPEYMKTGKATPEMRKVRFNLYDRIILIPVELVQSIIPMLFAAMIAWFAAGIFGVMGIIAAFLSGVILFPILMPWIPSRDFSSRGIILGIMTALPFVLLTFSSLRDGPSWKTLIIPTAYLLTLSPVTAYLALNFTGSTPFTSKTGVKREMKIYLPVMGIMMAIGIICFIIARVMA